MRFVGLIRSSLIEYPPYIAHITFVPGCIFRCDYCYNKEIVEDTSEENYTEKDLINMIKFDNKFSKFVKALVISGGEPLLYQKELKPFVEELKNLGLYVRIDTTAALKNEDFLEILNGLSITLKPISYYNASQIRNLKENLKISQDLDYNYRELRITLTQENYKEVLKTFDSIKNILDFEKWDFKIIKAKFIDENVHIGKFTLIEDKILENIYQSFKNYPFKSITLQK